MERWSIGRPLRSLSSLRRPRIIDAWEMPPQCGLVSRNHGRHPFAFINRESWCAPTRIKWMYSSRFNERCCTDRHGLVVNNRVYRHRIRHLQVIRLLEFALRLPPRSVVGGYGSGGSRIGNAITSSWSICGSCDNQRGDQAARCTNDDFAVKLRCTP